MPEYLAPGVYVEEVSFRAKAIEGVSTSTTGFAGMTCYGPVVYSYLDAGGVEQRGPSASEPRLITSYTEFERVFGGLTPLEINGGERLPFVGHAVRAFFDNGGRRVYIARVHVPKKPETDDNGDADLGVASFSIAVNDALAVWRARWPGKAGNVRIRCTVMRTRNLAYNRDRTIQVHQAQHGSVIEVIPAGVTPPADTAVSDIARLRVVQVGPGGMQSFIDQRGDSVPIAADEVAQLLTLRITVDGEGDVSDEYVGLATGRQRTRFIGRILEKDDPEDENAAVWLDWTEDPEQGFQPAHLMLALLNNGDIRLEGGNDGVLATPDKLQGEAADSDNPANAATGLEALAEIEDIAIVALPDGGTYDTAETCAQAADRLISHCELLKYRIAVVDGPKGSSLNEIRSFRGRFDSTRAALYHPWIEIFDPTQRRAQGAPPRKLMLPPSGFVCGIYARNDISRGVYKAPANEVVRGLTRFEANINTPRQDVLNPEGINCLRFFEGRGHRVWGARTMSSDPEWKYVNVRRLFIYIEHSIDSGTQWAVFEPNNSRLWANVRQTLEDFLFVLWRDGALLGARPEDAYFVRCDRTTMTQNDLDNGRLIALVGVAPVKPAEFVIFRIGQWTADAAIS